MFKKLAVSSLIFSLIFPLAAQAYSININNIITDTELLDSDSMSLARIQSFLKDKGSYLANYMTEGIGGAPKTAAEVIFDAANFYEISPKYLMVRLQVEQSLVYDTDPKQTQLDRAMGYGCPDGSGCDPEYSGFFNQINQSAKAIKGSKYLQGILDNGTTISGWGIGITKTTLDGIAVTPVNAATAILYTYTPWVGKYGGGVQQWGGTSLVGKLFQDWFIRHYPDGTLVQADGTSGVYLIRNGKRYPFRNKTTLLANYDTSKIIIVSPNELDAYEEGPAIRFPDNVLIRSPKGTVYVIVNGEKRGMDSQEVLSYLGFNPEEIIPASWSEVNSVPEGEPITIDSVFPTGILLQSRQTGGVAYIENGVRHPIMSREILKSRYKNRILAKVDQDEIEAYPKGDYVKFLDGELVTSDQTAIVYVISNGEKRPFSNADAFNSLGYSWDNIIHTNQRSLDIHPTGTAITVE
ncbi:hypothetical protein KJ705_01730 [Patescibacteria group bacterium]|nr:hypothetical protein [Patescibacteria group bacterium]